MDEKKQNSVEQTEVPSKNQETVETPKEAKVDAKVKELKDADTAKANAKISGKKKLKDLGLSDDEISALIGE